MCQIIVNKNKLTTHSIHLFMDTWGKNPDGAGWVDNAGKVHKALDIREAFNAWVKGDWQIFHFRYATSGAVSKANCHPFKTKSGEYLFHNGVMFNSPDEAYSDTALVASLDAPLFDKVLGEFISGNRFAIYDPKANTLELLGSWVEGDEYKFANTYATSKHLIHKPATTGKPLIYPQQQLLDDFEYDEDLDEYLDEADPFEDTPKKKGAIA